jgi:methionyl-tRNA formyltransferase
LNLRPQRAVVLAYHDVGVRSLRVLLANAGVDIALVITHRDAPGETIWFASVAGVAREHRLPLLFAEDLDAAALTAAIGAAAPDWLFSFYFRRMLPPAALALAPSGALNLHGSLLPHFRGRVPVNWAVIRGATETGATLHHMTAKPDAGDLVDQQAVPILPDDTALDVFRKVTVAGETVLHRALPKLLDGTAPRIPLDLTAGSYCGGRRPEDGRIDFAQPARTVHDLVRGVAPPYPGAFTMLAGRAARVLRSTWQPVPTSAAPGTWSVDRERMLVACGDGCALPVLHLEVDGRSVDAPALARLLDAVPAPLTATS